MHWKYGRVGGIAITTEIYNTGHIKIKILGVKNFRSLLCKKAENERVNVFRVIKRKRGLEDTLEENGQKKEVLGKYKRGFWKD